MPKKTTQRRVAADRRHGKSATSQAGEYIREVIDNVRKGKYGVKSAKQAIAIGLSKARKAGVAIGANPSEHKKSSQVRHVSHESTAKRARSTLSALRREGKAAVSHENLSKQSHNSAIRRGAASRHAAAKKAVRTRRIHHAHA